MHNEQAFGQGSAGQLLKHQFLRRVFYNFSTILSCSIVEGSTLDIFIFLSSHTYGVMRLTYSVNLQRDAIHTIERVFSLDAAWINSKQSFFLLYAACVPRRSRAEPFSQRNR